MRARVPSVPASEMKPGAKFVYTFKRDGKRRNVEFTLVKMPFEVAAEMVGTHLLVGHTHLEFDEDE